jgi:hypothetical protein
MMWFTSLFRCPKKYPKPVHVRRIGNSSHPRRSFVPRLESLEDRTVPSTLTVLNNLDSGAGSLRDTITNAKSGDMIVFAPSLNGQTIIVTSDQLEIKTNLDIEGPGAGLLAISGNDINRVFDISEGLTVTIAGLTITHGRTRSNQGGGGINNVGSSLTVAHDVLSYNVANSLVAEGGAIDNAGGTLNAIDTTFTGNQAIAKAPSHDYGLGFGGAIMNGNFYNPTASMAIVSGCTFTSNQAIGGDGGALNRGFFNVGEGAGGAIFDESGATLSVANSTFTANQAVAGNGGSGGAFPGFYAVDFAGGGAIEHFGIDLTLTIDQSTFTGNRAIGGSKAVASTVSGQGNIGIAVGGAVVSFFDATITNSVFDHNEAIGGSGNPVGASGLKVGQGIGGAVIEYGGFGAPASLTASNLTVTNNKAIGGTGPAGGNGGDGVGGGIAILGGGTLTLVGSTMSGNSATGGAGGAGGNGGNGLGGSIANLQGASLTVTGCTLTGNSATGGAGGSGASGGNGFGGGLYNDGTSTFTVTVSTITANQAIGGAADSGDTAGQGVGGGAYFAGGGVACLDDDTLFALVGNLASTSNNDVFGVFTIC